MAEINTDYLIVGAGAVGLAFADTLLAETDADIVIVDRHGKPGGHWNDAYSFVRLHQPSAFYGVNNVPLGSGRKDEAGPNKGYFELASGPEVAGYFEAVVNQRFTPSGRVRYFPMSEYLGGSIAQGARTRSLLSGTESKFEVRRKIVDATYYGTTVPSTHKPKFEIVSGVRIVPPNALPDLWKSAGAPIDQYVILGAGKTAMDVGVWLINSGADPDSITWIVPRDSWLLNRGGIQPGAEFFHQTIGGQANLMGAVAVATSADDLFFRLEKLDLMLRIDQRQPPSMFHYATIAKGEIDVLRRIKKVVRQGRVASVERDRVVLEKGEEPLGSGSLLIDCTASAVERRPPRPIFEDGLITLQMIRIPQPAFSAALAAYLEATIPTDEEKNALSAPIPLPDSLDQYLLATLINLRNQLSWSKNDALRRWIVNCRLDGFGKVVAAVSPEDAEKQAVMKRLRENTFAAAANLQRLIAEVATRPSTAGS